MGNIGFKILTFLLRAISLLPFRILYIFSDILSFFLYYIIRYRLKVVRTNLKNAFPEKSDIERKQIEKRYYSYLADIMVESVKSISISEKELLKRFRFQNLEELWKPIHAGKGVIAVSGHYGNWELGSVAIGQHIGRHALIVYKPLNNKNFDKFIGQVRSRFGAIMVPMKGTLRKLVEYKDRPYTLVLISDQTPSRKDSHYFTTFLNQPTAMFMGVEKIAVKANIPIVFFTIYPIKRGYYNCVLKLLVDDPSATSEYEITNLHAAELERVIRQKPEYWLWSHKRWKHKPENS
jgi:KDO2-lipid IV(A) lauroyltransferase